MTKLSSFNNLKLPEGIFPEFESFIINTIPLDCIYALKGLPLDKVNTYIETLDEAFENAPKIFDMPEFKEKIDPAIDYIRKRRDESMSWDELVSSPQIKTMNNNAVLLIRALAKHAGASDDSNESAVDFLNPIISAFEDIHQLLIILSMRFYMEGVDRAYKIMKEKDPHKNEYYRLGKVAKFFTIAHIIKTFPQLITTEINAINIRNNIAKKKRIDIAADAGAESNKEKRKLKVRCLKVYIKEKKNEPDIVKASFVRNFIDSLADKERQLFPTSNIHRYFSDAITDYNKGRLSKVVMTEIQSD